MDVLSKTLTSAADAISNATKPNCNILDKLSNVSAAFEKAADIGKITDVKFAPALKTAFDAIDNMEVFRPAVWQHTVKHSVNSAKVCLISSFCKGGETNCGKIYVKNSHWSMPNLNVSDTIMKRKILMAQCQ